MKTTRREFLRSAAAGASGAICGSVVSRHHALADESRNLPIVDTHQHLWDLERLPPRWLNGAPDILNRTYVTQDYLAATRGLNVVKAVYMEVGLAPNQLVAEAELVIDLCRSEAHPTVAAVISGRLDTEGFRPYILRFKESPCIKGVRQLLQGGDTPQGHCLQPEFVQSVRLLGELGMSFDLCMRTGELGDGVKLADKCPDTRFIVDHCGNADPKAFLPDSQRDARPSHDPELWRRNISELAQRSNVICKISGVVARTPKGPWQAEILAPVINHCLDAFGPDRVVFGGDWPVCLRGATYRRWVEALKEVIRDRDLQQQRKLLHDNAVGFYGLS